MVVFFDIDGTIVDEATQIIPDSVPQAIHALRRNGHLPVINTGRPYGHIDPRVRAMDFGGWVCGCGMQVILHDRMIYRDYPDPAICRQVADLAAECGMLILAEGEQELYYDSTVTYTEAPAMEAERMRKKGFGIRDLRESEDIRFIKFVTHDAPKCDRKRFLAGVSDVFEGIDRGGSMMEFVKKGNSKAHGMEILLRELNVPKEETFAIGDSTNDLPMFALAGTTICMGGGMEELKAQADYITQSVLEDGIMTGLRHFGLI